MAPHFRIDRVSISIFCAGIALLAIRADAQLATPRPFATPAPANAPPPRDVPVVEKKFEELSDQQLSDSGRKALIINAAEWKHAETPNFVLHFRRLTEARKVAREVEYNLWFIATTLGATRDRYARKSHVYIFESDDEWKQYLTMTDVPAWSASFASGDELFLNVRREGGGGNFDSGTLAHETAHAVVARLFPRTRWPLWLNEGFAEYMGGASVAARKGQTAKRHQSRLELAEMPLRQLEALQQYPADPEQVSQLYQSSEKFVRFLMNELPKDRIVKFIDAVLAGRSMQAAVLEVYGDKFKDWAAFEKKYARFTK
jgi:hypothetical protein